MLEDSKGRENIRATQFYEENHITYFVCNAVHIFIAFFVDKEDPRLEISAA